MTMIKVAGGPATLARAVAEHVVAQAADAVARRGRFLLVLAGGSTPRAAYEALASDAFASRVDWNRVHVFWGDERCVPPDDPRSNYRMAQEALLDRVAVPPAQVHRIRGEDEPGRAAAAYEHVLRDLLGSEGPEGPPRTGLDLVLLGLGADGHAASLWPGQAAVREPVRWVVAAYVEAVAMWRITLTPVVINRAHHVSFVVSGAAKADRVREVLEGPRVPDRLPAQALQPVSGRLTWLLDETAASRLRERWMAPAHDDSTSSEA